MKIAVAGGTGVVGRFVVEALRARGHAPVVLSRGQGVDLMSGSGLEAALAGAEAVIDVSNKITNRKSVSVDFFDKAGRHLVGAAERAGVRHLVTPSIVGVDRVKSPYYAGKLRQEEIVRDGAVPWTILRVTQFYEFAGQLLSGVPGPIAVVPTGRVQPIAAREVAEALADLAVGSPQAMAPELAGPQVESLVDMARRLIAAGGARRRPVLPLYFPGGMSNGGLLPTGPGPRGTQTFADWLREKIPATPA
ncbi:NAD(P)H-binding protein [Planotetraspora phitsanulokensis]|uniref:3-beta hydroxysteroid dehydrogenase n=1 Tax=Planotetraspora phitsanulokensis TaxID=575192 RepID=A0A8J3XD14_9ACTN|nr:NAD(P)H-binding protein [Planotetraspora phitsanulokensis]GII36004.1 3-beta hydroxysteroid dehydrogenase [Planotetraspora phitsanulokensis]